MLSIFKSKPLLEDAESQSIMELFLWAVEHFDSEYFLQHTQIVQPTEQFFPDRVSSVEEMAGSVFQRVKEYAGLTKWPIQLTPPQFMQLQQTFPHFSFAHGIRGESIELVQAPLQPVSVSYNPNQINQPQDLVASMAGSMALMLIHQVGKLPPGGQQNLAVAADVLAIFMGFGTMLCNTAYHFRGGCGSCYNPYANRQAALSEQESVFLHALVCHFKPTSQGGKHLKPHLKSMYKQAEKQLKQILQSTPDPLLLALEDRSRA
ncbi:hypothetical protein N474_21915 [Pseudoalteromonas luteoviolacea CPMOR-2]|uniref:Orphan protein n=1 Tax=Pseudoalteromonas luteoviolacea DSM 6061 TaxID=1365250 RepID=A0A166XIK7_9GAMM|nr:hypothetical protein [Pseudoalteromonas luteoviolacea]KZN40420.1 hypothetical protein N475_11625 [Pseudoalteromonas luteoviolacea DSM 6061]KZN53183.1 hypothetical protein N474_21915 [Pseudoalteromonas luteoviolacea CPMOR-2]MBE0387288.1 hypothetical protein [Pseudoalteromonas luteoviolacea DSM 6061]